MNPSRPDFSRAKAVFSMGFWTTEVGPTPQSTAITGEPRLNAPDDYFGNCPSGSIAKFAEEPDLAKSQ